VKPVFSYSWESPEIPHRLHNPWFGKIYANLSMKAFRTPFSGLAEVSILDETVMSEMKYTKWYDRFDVLVLGIKPVSCSTAQSKKGKTGDRARVVCKDCRDQERPAA
jgi:hypothetical protein